VNGPSGDVWVQMETWPFDLGKWKDRYREI
jgi:hypothetical protein